MRIGTIDGTRPQIDAESVRLTNRELQILSLVSKPCRNSEIAEALNIKTATVKVHVSNMLAGLGLRDRTELALWAINNPSAWQSREPVLDSTD